MSASTRLPVGSPLPAAALFAATLLVSGCREVSAPPLDAPRAVLPRPSAGELAAARRELARKRAKLDTQGPKTFDEPQEAAEFYLAQRLSDEVPELPWQRLRTELDLLLERERALAARPEAAAPGGVVSWDWLGPGNVGGRTRALVIDPTDPATMYAAGVAGGIWKTTDEGASWQVADDLMLNLAVCSLAMDPADPSVLYAGTGEGFFLSSSFVRGLGVFKSVDAGATWNQLSGTVSGVPAGAFDYVNKLVVSPNDSSRVYAGTRTGVWRSLDGGLTWAPSLSNPNYLSSTPATPGSPAGCTELVIRNDKNPDVLFAAFGISESDGLFRSLDGGDSWQVYGIPPNQGRMTLALAPSDNDIMYLLMADNGSGGPTGRLVDVFRSDDGGNSFTNQVDFTSLTGPWLLSNLILATGCVPGGTYSQGWYDNIIAVDPVDPNVVWVGGVDIFRSDDGGRNFEIPGYWIFYTVSPPPPYYIHPDHHTIVFPPDYDGVTNQTMYVGNDGGLFRTRNSRAATSLEDCPLPGTLPLPEVVWENVNNGYGVTQFYHGDAAKDGPVFIGGAQDNGTNRVLSDNTPDAWRLIFGGDGGYVAIDPTDSQVVYVEYQGFPTLQKSVDGGDTFAPAINGITDTDGLFITPFALDQANPDVLWTGGSRPWRTMDGAASWSAVGPNFVGPNKISAIAVSRSDPNYVYLGFDNGFVVRSRNGLSPSPTWTILRNGLYGGYVSSLAVDPFDPAIAYLTYSTFGIPHVLRTEDEGRNWSSIDGIAFSGVPDIPAHWIEVRPCDSAQLYVGTELGVFVSDDTGASWAPANVGLAHTVVESLDFQDEDTLIAFTHGRGAYAARLEPCPGRPPHVRDAPAPVKKP